MQRRAPTHFLDTLSALRRRLTGVADEAYAPLGVGAAQAKLLRAVGEHQPMSQADLARATRTDPALTGRALRRCSIAGGCAAVAAARTGARSRWELTPEGEALYAKVREARERAHPRASTRASTPAISSRSIASRGSSSMRSRSRSAPPRAA